MTSQPTTNPFPSRDEASLDVESLAFAEELYADYLRDPESIAPSWRAYFRGFASPGAADGFVPGNRVFDRQSLYHRAAASSVASAPTAHDDVAFQERVDRLVHAYRVR